MSPQHEWLPFLTCILKIFKHAKKKKVENSIMNMEIPIPWSDINKTAVQEFLAPISSSSSV